jgi:flagellar biosynthetic protein FliR
VAVALMIAPVYWNTLIPPTNHTLSLLITLAREAVLGLLLGLALLIVVAGLHIAGRLIGQMSGIALAEVIDPDLGTTSPLYGRLFDLVATAVFLLAGGHRQVLAALLDTFDWIEPGGAGFSTGLLETVNEVAAQSFLLAVRVSAPVVVALLLATLTVGFVSRAVPQLNSIMLGLSLNTMIAVAVVSVSLGGAAWLFHEHTEAAIETVGSAFATLAANR